MSRQIIPGAVVVGVDGSPGSDIAVVWAACHAAAERRPLAVVHGAGGAAVSGFGTAYVQESSNALLMAGRRILDDAVTLAQRTSPGLRTTVHLEMEDPRALLLRMAADCCLLVVGPRGHGMVANLLMGSVSTAVTTHAPCRVVVARVMPRPDGPDRLPVVVGVDGTEASTGAIRFAFETASWQQRPLHAVHATGEAGMRPYADLLTEEQLLQARADRDALVGEALAGWSEKFPDVTSTVLVSSESPVTALRHASQAAHAVVVGTRRRGAMSRWLLGSVSRSVVDQSRCSVAVVPQEAS